MRVPLIAGNWKMNLLRESGVALVKGLIERIKPSASVAVAVCPPAVYLQTISDVLRGSSIGLGAQNMYHEKDGAFTGEISAGMLCDIGCQYVILGHSERRQFFGDTDATVNVKTKAAIAAKLTPIVCVGETLTERESNKTDAVITEQIQGSLAGLTAEQASSLVVAYEPVWAIGTGKTATPEQAEQVHALIRSLLSDSFGKPVAESIRIQYGGSVKPENAAELLSQPNIDGALVGGASLKADGFAAIVAAAN